MSLPFDVEDADGLYANLVMLSNDLPEADMLVAAIKPGFQHVTVESGRLWTQVGERAWEMMCATEHPVRVHLVGWGAPGSITLSGNVLDLQTISDFVRYFGDNPPEEILLYGSRVADGLAGDRFCRALASEAGSRVIASRQAVGRNPDGRNYWFDGLGHDLSLCFDADFLESYPHSF